MLDNEPTTEAADTAAPARKTTRSAAKKTTTTTTTRKRAAKKTAAAEEVPAQPDGETADPASAVAKKAAKKAAAKKTTVKKGAAKTAEKAPAKKTTSKRAAKKAVAQDAFPELTDDAARAETSTADGGPVVESAPAPAKKTARKRTAKKAAAPDLLTADSPVTDGPVADTSAEASSSTGSAGFGPPVVGSSAEPAGETSTRRTRRRAPATTVLFQAPTDVPSQAPAQAAATSPVEATPPAADQTSENISGPAAGSGTEQVAEEPTARRRRSRRSRDAEARDTGNEAHETDRDGEVREADRDADSRRSGRNAGTRKTGRGARGAEGDAEAPEEVAADAADPVLATAEVAEDDQDTDTDAQTDGETDAQAEDDEGGEGTRRRRRRRGGRRRRKSGDADEAGSDEHDDSDESDDHETDGSDDDQDASADADEDGGSSSSRRRRRRRRRKGEDNASSPDDPDETVVRVREPRSKNTENEITAVEGSTRLEAKKQRRREGRAAGRRRAPIVTEAEFLARRESVERTMVIRARGDLTQIAVSEDNVLVEHYVAQEEQVSLIGNVYLGRVQNVLPSMEAAFIDIGKGRNAVLYAGEVDWGTLGGSNGPRKIEQVLKSGQAVLVQVTKDPIGHKGARLTNQISLPGRYVVYVPRGGNGGISRKLPDTERNRLKGILKDIVPDEAGVIVRTAAEGASEEELTADVSRLQKYWNDIDKKSKSGQAPQLLHGEPDLLIRVVRDLFTEDFTTLVISGDEAYDQVREYVSDVAPHLADRVEKWSGDGDVFSNYRIDEQIKKALDRKVWLPSGGSLIIDRTEAMTVVDVNTGKFTGSGGNLEETVTKNNLEAAEEIVRQLRLRDIGGIIVIDFIDMVLESNRDLVLRRLVECLGRDRTKHQVAEVTSLGLVQMTRKRIGTGLLEAFSENCDHCGGRGLILHDEPKESRRRDGGNNGGNNSGGNGNGQSNGQSNGQGGGNENGKSAAQSEDGGRKSRRRGRGKGRGEEEQAEPEAQHNGDAAQRLAQIAAASKKAEEDAAGTPESAAAEGTPGPTGYPVTAEAEDHVSPEPPGFPAAADETPTTVITETPESTEAAEAPRQAKTTRRRRSSRGRSKATADGDAGTSGSEAAELVSTVS